MRIDRLTGLLFVLAISAPGATMLVLGPDTVDDNSPAAEPPAAEDVLSLDSEALQRLNDYLAQRTPVRQPAIAADALLDREVFNQSPNPQVTLGAGEWLFLTEALAQPCMDAADVEAARADVTDAVKVAARADIELLVSIAPEKETVATQRLGPAAEAARCSRANADLIDSVASATPGLLYPRERLRSLPDTEAYHAQDSHWTRQGATVWVEAVMERLAPATLDAAGRTDLPPSRMVQDLSRLIGLPTEVTEEQRGWTLGAEPVDVPAPDGALRTTLPAQDAVPGNTVYLHDSFGWAPLPALSHLFRDLTNFRLTWAPGSMAVPSELPQPDRVVVLMAQRGVPKVLSEGELTPFVAELLASSLPTGRSGSLASIPAGADHLRVTTDLPSATPVDLVTDSGTVVDRAWSNSGRLVFRLGETDGAARLRGPDGDLPDPVDVIWIDALP
ncbi:MAG: alginate O-acetyltransferase AlgX-related protein [Actinomycetes bacterium]